MWFLTQQSLICCCRIPVYESARQNILGILYVKDLILVDPDDETELSAVLAFRSALLLLWFCASACSTCGVPTTDIMLLSTEHGSLSSTHLLQVLVRCTDDAPRMQLARRQSLSSLLSFGKAYFCAASFCCVELTGNLLPVCGTKMLMQPRFVLWLHTSIAANCHAACWWAIAVGAYTGFGGYALQVPHARRGREVACVREDVQLDEVFRLFMSSAVHARLLRAPRGSMRTQGARGGVRARGRAAGRGVPPVHEQRGARCSCLCVLPNLAKKGSVARAGGARWRACARTCSWTRCSACS